MTDNQIKTGRTGHIPTITEIIWQGTAEVTACGFARVAAAWVRTSRGECWAIVQLAGNNLTPNQWWDARCVPSREWETADGQLIGEAIPEIADNIEAFFKTADDRHVSAARTLNARLASGKYSLAH